MINLLRSRSIYVWVTISITVLSALFVIREEHFLSGVIALIAVTSIFLIFEFPTIAFLGAVLFAPLSIAIEMNAGFKIGLPSESIMLTLIPAFLLAFGTGKIKLDLKVINNPLSLILLADLVWTFITSVLSVDNEVSLKRFVLKASLLFVYYFCATHIFKKQKWANLFFPFYIIGMIVPMIYAFYQHSESNFSQNASFDAPKPFFDDHTIFGACLAFVLPFVFYQMFKTRHRTLFVYILTGIVLTASLYLSFSRASWISVLIALVSLVMILKGSKMIHFLLITVVGISLIGLNIDYLYNSFRENDEVETSDNPLNHIGSVTNLSTDASNMERINRWKSAWEMYKERPLTGFGPGTYQFVYGSYQSTADMTRISTTQGNQGNAHSEYFAALSETGLIGLILLLGIIFCSLHLAIRLLNHKSISVESKILIGSAVLGLITFYAHSSFNSFLDSDKMAILVYGSMAIIVSVDLKLKNKEESKTISSAEN